MCAIVNYFSLRPQVSLSTNIQHVSAWSCVTNLISSTAANFLYIKVYLLTLRRLMAYIYIYIYVYIYIYIYMEQPFLMFLDHTQRRSTVGRTPLDE